MNMPCTHAVMEWRPHGRNKPPIQENVQDCTCMDYQLAPGDNPDELCDCIHTPRDHGL